LENLNDSEDTMRAWENVKENIKTSDKERISKPQIKREYQNLR